MPTGEHGSFASDIPDGTLVVLGSSMPVVSSQSVKPSPSLSVVLMPTGEHGSFASDIPDGTLAVLGSSTPVVSSQSVKPSPSLSTALGHPGIVIVIVAVSHTAGVTAVLHTS